MKINFVNDAGKTFLTLDGKPYGYYRPNYYTGGFNVVVNKPFYDDLQVATELEAQEALKRRVAENNPLLKF